MSFTQVAVLGLGKVGALAATLLGEGRFSVTGFDMRTPRKDLPFRVVIADLADSVALAEALKPFEAVLSCLPYHLNLGVAKTAHGQGLHYFDLTEDVATTRAILEMSVTAKGVVAPQCGLAPGFVGIVGADLARQFDSCRAIRLRVGALPRNPTGLMGYAFNWSPEGVVNEYLNDCEVIEEGHHKWVSPMEWIETLYIDGIKLEAFTTSGGLGTMCDTFLGKVNNLDYKTIRYPGHAELMNFFFHELLMRERRALAGEILTHAKPPVDEDVVFIHVSAEGTVNGALQRKEFVRAYHPINAGGERRTAIAWTTSASVVSVIEMVRDGRIPSKGFLKQEEIPLAPFLETIAGHHFTAGVRG
jgi:saccharopine dehydrogenase-like NADP-dependent oxidoreductase